MTKLEQEYKKSQNLLGIAILTIVIGSILLVFFSK